MRRPPLVILSLVVGLVLSAGSVRAQQESETPALSQPVFEFHSGFWVNLHHFLYLEGRIRNAGAQLVTSESQAQRQYAQLASTDGLTPDEQKAWNAALSVYAADWSSRDLLNGDMVLMNDRLAELENCPDLSGKSAPKCAAGLRSEIVAALEEAAPVYRARWWPEQDRENRAWIAAIAPFVRRMGASLAERLAGVYQRNWRAEPIRVDVVWYAGPQGAYTSLGPVHITIASHDSRNQSLAAFEMLFQEASHALAEGVSQAIARECRQRGKPIPRDLWDALLFYTTGELVRRAFADAPAATSGLDFGPGYTPYAYRNGLYDHGWSNYQRVLERYWQPYLDGKLSFDTAIARIVSAL
jgi:hypothetical protein